MERQEIVDRIVHRLREEPRVLACWEGGSVAFGTADALSDVDLQVMVREEAVGAVVEIVEALFREDPGFAARLELPQPTWHGSWQAFYLLHDTSPFHMLDLVVLKESATERFLEPERHGRARVHIDRGGYARPTPLDRMAHTEKVRRRAALTATSFRVLHWLVDKEIARGRPVDAMHFYQAMVARVIELARSRHCPDRFDFGGRYLQRDLPAELYSRIEPLYFVSSLEDLGEKKRALMAVFEEVAPLSS